MRFKNGKINTALLVTVLLFVYLVLDIVIRTITTYYCPVDFWALEPVFRVGALIVNPITVPLALVAGLTQLILGLIRKREDEKGL